MELVYVLDKGFQQYEEAYHYPSEAISQDEVYARQLCEYFVKEGKQFKLLSNEMEDGTEILVVKEDGIPDTFRDEVTYSGDEIYIEFRKYQRLGGMPLLSSLKAGTHWEVIRFLLKDVVDIPGVGLRVRDSAEIDEDRKVYVIYVKEE
ncbi:RNA helicase [Bacillus sp. AK031]